MPGIETLGIVEHFLKIGKESCSTTAITVVANLRDHRSTGDVSDLQTEYLDEADLRTIIGGFREAGYYTSAFVDEIEFIKWLVIGDWRADQYKTHAVYSIAQQGIGPGRHALVPAAANMAGMLVLTPDPYSGCLARHKFHAYSILRAAGLLVPRTWLYDPRNGWMNARPPANGLRVIAKPNLESASVGIGSNSVFEFSDASLLHLAELTRSLRQPIVIQEFITGWETETPVLISDAAIALDPVGISVDEHLEIGERFLDYATANNDKYRFFDFEQTDAALSERVREAAARAALVLGLTGIARIDFRISSSGECYIIDITGKPHLSQHSSVAARFGMLGYRYRDIFSMLVGLAGARS